MRYFCVKGNAALPLYLPKITARHARLLERHIMQNHSFLPDAEKHLLAVQAACAQLTGERRTGYSTKLCLHTGTAHVSVFVPRWNLRPKDLELLRALRPHLVGLVASPFAFGLKLLFKVRYFPHQASSVEQDLREISEKYTDN